MDKTDTEYREVPHGQLHLERAEAALFGRFVVEVNDGKYDVAGEIVSLMERLSIV